MPKTETFDRTEVLKKVTDLFWRKGYSATSMQEIVDASGLNRSSLYNSFGDKYQLYLACLKYYKGNNQSDFVKCLLNNSPKESLRQFFSNTAEFLMKKDTLQGCFLTKSVAELASRDEEVAAFLNTNMQDMTHLFSDILTKGIEQGDFKKEMDVQGTALYLFTSLQGMQLTGMLTKSKPDMMQLVDRILEGL
jgi:TetR/AcrR family transcriptional repressor of nem operon